MSLNDILVTPLKRIPTSGGDVLHAMKYSDAGFTGFGEAYFSWVSSDAVKAWKRHMRMTMNLVVPLGLVRFVFWSPDNGAFREEVVGPERYMRLTVPPGIWFGFQGLADSQSLVLNLGSIAHDPNEVERLPQDHLQHVWKLRS